MESRLSSGVRHNIAMAIQLLKPKGKATQPLNNSRYHGISFDDRQRYIAETIMRKIRETPELLGILDTIVTDHFQGPVDFFDSAGKPLGPTKLKQVRTFWQDQNVMNSFYGQAIDYFSDGSSFGWHMTAAQFLNTKQKETIFRIKSINPDLAVSVEESANMPRKISYLPASITEIEHDEFGIKRYFQDSAGKRVYWQPEQVVHIKLMEFNGEVRGMSGLKGLIKEITMMYMLKENILAAMQNGGAPDNIISLVGANGFSKSSFARLQTALESFSHLRKSHGNMPIDADVKVHPLGIAMKDMEYRELAMFALSEFCLAIGVPTSRIPFMMTGAGGTNNKGELSSNAEDSYQKKINNRRMSWECEWNKVFMKAGFMFQFRRDNVMDEVRETQASTQRAAYVLSAQNVLKSAGLELTDEALLSLLSGTKKDIQMEDVVELDLDRMQELMQVQNPQMNDDNPINKNDMKSNIPRKNAISEARSEHKTKFASNKGRNS